MRRKYFNRANYPDNWDELRKRLISKRARRRCECKGKCGEAHGKRVRSRCNRKKGQELPTKKGGTYQVALQLAHRCSCFPKCSREDHIEVLCQGCHLRRDMDKHVGRRKRAHRELIKEMSEQQDLFA